MFTLPAMLFIIVFTGHELSFNILYCFISLILLFVFCLGVGLFLAAFAVYFRDLFHLYGVILTAMNYATPIFYPEKIIPDKYLWIVKINPLYYFLKSFREAVYANQMPEGGLILICALIALSALIIGITVFKRKQNEFILYI